MRPEEKKVA
jgi:hypothetical protein